MLPESYQGLSEKELVERITSAKTKLGNRLVILGHHYQREEVIRFADFRGDSYGLSKIASEQKSAEFIVFCGVHFMAEAARILARPNQRVFHPDMTSGCPMADMASIDEVEFAWESLDKCWDLKKTIPVTYMNSVAAIKAFCGKNGGIICTSGNASRVFDWAFNHGNKIFFFPDEHLGRNTARVKGIVSDNISVWDPKNPPDDLSSLENINVLLWKGFCHVHTYFTVKQIKNARKNYPDCKVIVHPECTEDVVMASDESGSTEGICKYVESQPKGTTIVVGTEINLVNRLAKENPDKKIVPLARSLCPNMFKISLNDLCWTLEQIVKGDPVNEIIVPADISKNAKLALERMLTV